MYLKFLNTEHIDYVLGDGTLIVSSFQYFRNLEATKGPWIGDRLEGASELVTPGNYTLTEGSPELRRVNEANIGFGMFDQFAKVSGGGRIEIGNVRFVHQLQPMHIYSFASGDLDELKLRMCIEASDPYDACLGIPDPGALAQAICDTGEISEGPPVRTLFGELIHDSVRYEAVTQDIRFGNAIPPSAFHKAPRFAPQREERFVLIPRMDSSTLRDRITIRLPNASKYFEEVFRDFKR